MKHKHYLIGHNAFINLEFRPREWTTPFISFSIFRANEKEDMHMIRIGLLCFQVNGGVKI